MTFEKKPENHISMNLPEYAVPKCCSNNRGKTVALELCF